MLKELDFSHTKPGWDLWVNGAIGEGEEFHRPVRPPSVALGEIVPGLPSPRPAKLAARRGAMERYMAALAAWRLDHPNGSERQFREARRTSRAKKMVERNQQTARDAEKREAARREEIHAYWIRVRRRYENGVLVGWSVGSG
jgi:hypothetical protein